MIDRHTYKPHIMILAGEKCLPLARASFCTLGFADASGNAFNCRRALRADRNILFMAS